MAPPPHTRNAMLCYAIAISHGSRGGQKWVSRSKSRITRKSERTMNFCILKEPFQDEMLFKLVFVNWKCYFKYFNACINAKFVLIILRCLCQDKKLEYKLVHFILLNLQHFTENLSNGPEDIEKNPIAWLGFSIHIFID